MEELVPAKKEDKPVTTMKEPEMIDLKKEATFILLRKEGGGRGWRSSKPAKKEDKPVAIHHEGARDDRPQEGGNLILLKKEGGGRGGGARARQEGGLDPRGDRQKEPEMIDLKKEATSILLRKKVERA